MKFDKTLFVKDGPYCLYPYNGKLSFVARFKHVPTRRGPFITFLCKNFSVEEYFAEMAQDATPLDIVQAKGFSWLPKSVRARV